MDPDHTYKPPVKFEVNNAIKVVCTGSKLDTIWFLFYFYIAEHKPVYSTCSSEYYWVGHPQGDSRRRLGRRKTLPWFGCFCEYKGPIRLHHPPWGRYIKTSESSTFSVFIAAKKFHFFVSTFLEFLFVYILGYYEML